MFLKGSRININQLTNDEKEGIVDFVDYAGGLGKDVRSNIYKLVKVIENTDYQAIESTGNFIFRSSKPDSLVERLELLVVEHLASNTNAYREA